MPLEARGFVTPYAGLRGSLLPGASGAPDDVDLPAGATPTGRRLAADGRPDRAPPRTAAAGELRSAAAATPPWCSSRTATSRRG